MRHNWHVAWRQLLYTYIDIFTIVFVAVQRLNEEKTNDDDNDSDETTTFIRSMWLRVVLLDRHNIWDVHGCRSHTFCLFYCIYYILHTKIIDRSRGIFCILHTHTYSKCKTKYKSNVFVKAKWGESVLDLLWFWLKSWVQKP